jgi:flagellar motility protein MotE (MotC chaperone)
MPQSAEHKAKIASGVRAYHACARSKGCGKGAKKSVTAVRKKAARREDKERRQLDKMKAEAKVKLQRRLEERKKPVKKTKQMTYNQFKKTPEGKKWIETRESLMGSYYASNLKDYWNNTRLRKGATTLEYIKKEIDRVVKGTNWKR